MTSWGCVRGRDVVDEVGELPPAARRLDTGGMVIGVPSASRATREACGYYEVLEAAAPAAPVGYRAARRLSLSGGVVRAVWALEREAGP